MNIPVKLRIFACLALTATYSFAEGDSWVQQHAAKATGVLTGLCSAKFLHTSVKSLRQGTGLPRSKGYLLNGLAILAGAYATHYLHANNAKKEAAPAPTPTPEKPSLLAQISAIPLPAAQQAEENLKIDPKVATQNLINAITRGNLEGVKVALAQGADVNASVNGENQSPLYYVAAQPYRNKIAQLNQIAITKELLVTPDIQVNACDIYGNSALHAAAHYGHSDIVKLLLEPQRTININVQNLQGRTPLYNAKMALFSTTTAAKQESLAATVKLLEDDLRTNAQDREAINGLIAKLQAEADEQQKAAPLFQAVAVNDRATIKRLFKTYGHLKDADGNTVLHLAAQHGHADMVQQLIQRRNRQTGAPTIADINAPNAFGETPLQVALQKNHNDCISALAFEAVERGSLEILRLLPAQSLNTLRDHETQEPLLHKAVHKGNFECVEFLFGHNVDLYAQDETQETALHIALDIAGQQTCHRMVELLLNHDHNRKRDNNDQRRLVNMLDDEGNSALHYVLVDEDNYNAETALLLIQHGADPLIKNHDGLTAWQDLTDAQRAPLEQARAAYLQHPQPAPAEMQAEPKEEKKAAPTETKE